MVISSRWLAPNGSLGLVVPGLTAGQRYKYEIKDPNGNRLPHKADPVGFFHEQYPSFASIISDQSTYSWHDDEWRKSQYNNKLEQPISIYEVHLGSWKHNENGKSLNYRELAVELVNYCKEMGYTHVELLPIMGTRSLALGVISPLASLLRPHALVASMTSSSSSIASIRPV